MSQSVSLMASAVAIEMKNWREAGSPVGWMSSEKSRFWPRSDSQVFFPQPRPAVW